MSRHKYPVGAMIVLKDGPVRLARTTGVCKILATLPETGGALQYRIRFESEGFDRCVAEDDIDPDRSHGCVPEPTTKSKEQVSWLKASSVRTAK
ncbi:cold-shock protein [Rhizobium wuzhouense]|uniref:Cold-shock protein n=1 Tax=Rhizobium wuzhouense TaxID=1986026 RepID=A0ABX5NWG0_9HYPH|nr:cold-shock protein [Rhizobium wuzhouense]